MSSDNQTTTWVILEAMGHRVVAGRYFFENGLHRVDVPDPNDPEVFRGTQRYGSEAIYCITEVNEETARSFARNHCDIPPAIPYDVRRELRQLAAPESTIETMMDDDEDGYGEDDYEDAYDDLDP